MKTIRQWLETLPDGYRELALERMDCDESEICESFHLAMLRAFEWDDVSFWDDVSCSNGDWSRLPPIPGKMIAKPKATKASMTKAKLNWSLLTVDCRKALEQVAKVMQHGAKKYGERNWAEPEGRDEFVRELMSARERHWTSHLEGDDPDNDSGWPHLAHVCACDILLLQISFM